MNWIIETSDACDATRNMEMDLIKLEALHQNSTPYLRFYSWSSLAATYGYFINPADYFNEANVIEVGLSLARRPTGGGIIFHLEDIAFSIIIPESHPIYSLNSLTSYQKINQLVLEGIKEALSISSELALAAQLSSARAAFCMTKMTHYDLSFHGKKIGGAAQRKTKKGLLHQGSICYKLPEKNFLKKVLINGENIWEEMNGSSYELSKVCPSIETIKTKIVEQFQKTSLENLI